MVRRREVPDCTVEEFYDWSAKTDEIEAVAKAADERGGPRLTLVPTIEQEIAWPTDLLPPAHSSPSGGGNRAQHGGGGDAGTSSAEAAAQPEEAPPETPSEEPSEVAARPFDGVALEGSRKRLAGWSAERQRLFLETLAETGSVHLASSAARLSARGAYRLRTRSPEFARAWDTALQLSVGRLAAIVFDRAINGRVEQVYEGGRLVAERRVPSDKLLTWLLARLDPRRFALPWEQRAGADPQAQAVAAFPALLEAVADVPS